MRKNRENTPITLSLQNKNEITATLLKIEESLTMIKEMFFVDNKECNMLPVSDYITGKIQNMESHFFLNKGEAYTASSIHNWSKFQRIWNSFTMETYDRQLVFDDITISTYYDFMRYCDSRFYRKNTKYLYATLLKATLNYAFSDGVSNNRLFANRNFITHTCSDTHQHIYLTTKEIERIANLPLKEKSTLDKVRDVFLVGCYTGQRVSDYSSLSISDFDTIEVGNNKYRVIKKKQKKTGNIVIIPIINDDAIRILNKWGGKMPKIAISTLNSRIKTICRLSGITDIIKKYETIGGKQVETLTTKDRLVSSHTARRSCITNLYLEGKLDTVQIRSISGHKSEQAFTTYLCYSPEEHAKQIIEKMQRNA